MRIGFCGSMCVGKTTLVNALEASGEFPNYKFTTERSKYLRDLGIPLNTDSTLKGQIIFLAERSAELINENIITDRTVIDVMAFTSVAKSISFHEKDDFMKVASRLLKEYDYIFYVEPGNIPIEDNGVREINARFRKDIDDIIKYNLKYYAYSNTKVINIKGTTEERIEQVLNVINS